MIDYNKSWDAWADNRIYGATPRHLRRIISSLISGLEYSSVLDIGCGNGSFLKFIGTNRKKPVSKLAGVDLSEKALAMSKETVPNGSFSALNIENGHLDDTFDLILCNDVLEHLNNDDQALRNIRQMAKRYFVCNTIQGKMRESEREVGHLRNYKKEELIKKLKVAGFNPLRIIEWGFPFYNLLCRRLNIGMRQQLIYGKYGFFKRFISHIVYLLFMLNSKKRGDILIVLSEAKR